MAVTEDAASVLEQFIHDVANLPAEIAHLYEEANAKQDLINECNALIAQRDGFLQKHVRTNGSLIPHPKEDALCRSVREAYDRAQTLQEEKIALVTKACSLMERYVKRLDIKIRDLQSEGLFPLDNNMPTLLRQSNGNLVPVQNATPASTTAIPSALQPSTGNAGPRFHPSSSSRAAAAAAAAAAGAGGSGSISAAIASAIRGTGNATTASGALTPGLPDAKRRRLNASLVASLQSNAPVTGQTRHSSLGPGTPKASTPGTTSRAGSVGPGSTTRPSLKKSATMPRRIPGVSTPGASGIVTKKVRIGSTLGPNGPAGTPSSTPPVESASVAGAAQGVRVKHANGGPIKLKKKKDKKRGLLPPSSGTSTRNSPAAKAESTPDPDSKKKKDIKAEEEDQDPDAMDVDDKPKSKRTASATSSSDSSEEDSSSEEADSSDEEDDNEEEDEEEEEEEEEEEDGVDDTKYCYCHDVSHGDMIACDNVNCGIQWFHLACAGITEIPQGEWLCKECKRLPKDKIRTNN